MTEAERWAWLAGLLEGEGYFGATKWSTRRWVLRVTLNMTDRDIVERARDVAGTPNIKISEQDRSSNPGWKNCHYLQWTGQDAERIMRGVLPLMGARRGTKIREALAQDLGHRRKTHCIRGHPLSGDNVRWEGEGRKCKTCERERNRNRKRAKGVGTTS